MEGFEAEDTSSLSGHPLPPTPGLIPPDFRIVVDNHGPVIFTVPYDGAMTRTGYVIVDADGNELPADTLNAEAAARTAGVVFEHDTGRRFMVSPEPSVLLVVRVSGLEAEALGANVLADNSPEQEVLSASPSYSTMLPDSFQFLPVINTYGVSDDEELQYSGQLVGVLRGPWAERPRSESGSELATRLGWVVRLHPVSLLRLPSIAWDRVRQARRIAAASAASIVFTVTRR
jgi:hypothetical protein